MAGFTVAKFKDVSDGLQEGQFAVGERKKAQTLADLDPTHKQLLDMPITVTLGLTGPDGRVNMTPMWFDYDGDKVLVNTAAHRAKCGWIRKNPRLTMLLVNPENPYHWMSIKATVVNEIREGEPGGERAAEHIDRMWTKYTGQDPPYGLRGQFAVGERKKAQTLADLDPTHKQLLDMPITVTLGLTGSDGRVNMTPMWFDYDGDKVLVNTAAHRAKCGWIRKNPRLTMLLVNPENPYHWMSIKATVVNEIREGEPGGERAAEHIDRMWTKYTGQEPPYGLRDPVIDEKRVLFECRVDRVATFGKP